MVQVRRIDRDAAFAELEQCTAGQTPLRVQALFICDKKRERELEARESCVTRVKGMDLGGNGCQV